MQYSFKNTSNESLLQKTKSLVAEERRLTTEILACLREVEDRLLYAELGYSSLYEFTTQELGYSEGSAHRRISAMRLLKTLPEEAQADVDQKLKDGSLSLTNVALVQGFLKTEKKIGLKSYSAVQKVELLTAIEHQSKRETEKMLAQLQPAIQNPDRERIVANGTEITFIADDQLVQKIRKIRNLCAHRNADASYAELIHQMADLMIQKLEKKTESQNQKIERSSLTERGSDIHLSGEVMESGEQRGQAKVDRKQPLKRIVGVSNENPWPASRFIPIATRRKVWLRDQAKCTYLHPQTGKVCSSQFGLEIDHIRPYEMGGTHALENLRLRCRAHNLLHLKKTG